jgi:hypothetical protein
MDDASTIAGQLDVPERVLLFCLASGTEWAQACVTGATTSMMLVRGLVERDSTGGLKMTPRGRGVFKAARADRDCAGSPPTVPGN